MCPWVPFYLEYATKSSLIKNYYRVHSNYFCMFYISRFVKTRRVLSTSKCKLVWLIYSRNYTWESKFMRGLFHPKPYQWGCKEILCKSIFLQDTKMFYLFRAHHLWYNDLLPTIKQYFLANLSWLATHKFKLLTS